MPDIDDLIEMFISLIVIFLLGYVFYLVFWQLSPLMAVLFIVAVAIIVIGILLEITRRD